jgi:hypothetical protein
MGETAPSAVVKIAWKAIVIPMMGHVLMAANQDG